jgi:hypothetical protein
VVVVSSGAAVVVVSGAAVVVVVSGAAVVVVVVVSAGAWVVVVSLAESPPHAATSRANATSRTAKALNRLLIGLSS